MFSMRTLAVPSWALALVMMLPAVDSVQCGRWYSNGCRGDEDIRFDPDASDNLADQAEIWGKIGGFFIATNQDFDGENMPLQEAFWDPVFLGYPYPGDNYMEFLNSTVSGSRLSQHSIFVNRPASDEFCSLEVPEGFINVLPPGECGVNGATFQAERFFTSSYERDGSASLLPISTLDDMNMPVSPPPVDEYRTVPVDENTYYYSTFDDAGFFQSTVRCLDNDCNQYTSTFEFFVVVESQSFLTFFTRSFARRVTEQEFIDGLQAAYEENNILESNRYTVPFDTCVGAQYEETLCLTEDDWCQQDPECSESIYQEPDGTVKAGVIAGFTVAGFVLIIGAIVLFFMYRLRMQEHRFREKFARRIAETITIEGTKEQLTPENLAEEFKKIDVDGGGDLSKEELWEFMQTGKAGTISESDFNALFAALDSDKSGTVDYVEFCAFLGQVTGEFNQAKNRQSVRDLRETKGDDEEEA